MRNRGGLSPFIQALPENVVEYASAASLGTRKRVPWKAPVARQDEDDPARPSVLRPGDKVNHPAFGPGVISRFMDKEKVEVVFRNWGRKLLHLGYTTLEKM
jgi:DNA helicase-2/ATP-dependent DNA helicase PcrA